MQTTKDRQPHKWTKTPSIEQAIRQLGRTKQFENIILNTNMLTLTVTLRCRKLRERSESISEQDSYESNEVQNHLNKHPNEKGCGGMFFKGAL